MAKGKIADSVDEKTQNALNKIANENPEKPLSEEGTKVPGRRFNNNKYKNPNNITEALERYPIHIVKLVGLLKSNGHICRYTSLAILNYLYQKGICTKKENGKIGYVEFKWTKFKVNNNGLCTEYRYTEPFFLNCLIASFTSFANEAQKIIKNFCSKEYEDVFVQDDSIIKDALAYNEQANVDSGDDYE